MSSLRSVSCWFLLATVLAVGVSSVQAAPAGQATDLDLLMHCPEGMREQWTVDCMLLLEEQQLALHGDIARRDGADLYVGPAHLKNSGEGDAAQRYYFLGLFPGHDDVAIVRLHGHEASHIDFVSLNTGSVLLSIPPTSGGHSQLSLAPQRDFLLVVSTSSGDEDDAHLTDIALFSLQEASKEQQEAFVKACLPLTKAPLTDLCLIDPRLWPPVFNQAIREAEPGYTSYDITWQNDHTVRIQARAPQEDYVIFSGQADSWEVVEQHYHRWSDYQWCETDDEC